MFYSLLHMVNSERQPLTQQQLAFSKFSFVLPRLDAQQTQQQQERHQQLAGSLVIEYIAV